MQPGGLERPQSARSGDARIAVAATITAFCLALLAVSYWLLDGELHAARTRSQMGRPTGQPAVMQPARPGTRPAPQG